MAIPRERPYSNFNFLVDLGNGNTDGPEAGFEEVILPEVWLDVIEYRNGNEKENSVRKLTGGLGADIVICANPVAATQTQAVELVRKAGKVILFGGLPKANPLTTLDANRIHYGEITVVGSFSYHPRFHAQAIDVLQRNLIPAVGALVTHTFPLA